MSFISLTPNPGIQIMSNAYNTAIIIPARYGSSRFPGKPLVEIAGKTMLQRVYEAAQKAASSLGHCEVLIATEDQRIIDHAAHFDAPAVLTPDSCKTGSDRVLSACEHLDSKPELILNLQGDAPFTPPHVIQAVVQCLIDSPECDVATPIEQLSWPELDNLREHKSIVPFSGTTAIIDSNNKALWFSKNIIPALRKEEALRQSDTLSPIFRHIGLYGFKRNALQQFVSLPESHYEALEGLEQLRMLEHGMHIQTVMVDTKDLPSFSGIDTPEDARKAEQLLKEHGELL